MEKPLRVSRVWEQYFSSEEEYSYWKMNHRGELLFPDEEKDQMRCNNCYRRGVCRVENLARQTRDYLLLLELEEDNDKREHQVGRYLRGSDDCPGYLEDAIFAGLLSRGESLQIISEVTRKGPLSEVLLSRCRGYLGPAD